MTTIKHILVPVDFSPCSQAALEYAASLAERFGAAVDLLYVIEPPGYGNVDPAFFGVSTDATHPIVRPLRDQAARDMEEMLVYLSRRGIQMVSPRLETGDVPKVILKLAGEKNYDLVVMGTHGRTGLERLILGSVAEKVVRRSPCPVLTVRQETVRQEEAHPQPV